MENKLKELKKALKSFEYLANVNTDELKNLMDERLIDGIENGKIQKFEYTTELLWKFIKKYLKEYDGIDAKTPKQSIKEYYKAGYVDEKKYLKMISIIDDRNSFSHIYNEDEFKKILAKFPEYAKVIKKVVKEINL